MKADGHADGRTIELPMDDAAVRLGISKEALRKRISRGTIEARKVDDVWMVTIAPEASGRSRPRTVAADAPERPSVRPRKDGGNATLIARLESENEFLRQQVERQNHIIAGLIQRVPLTHELAAGEVITVGEELSAEPASTESDTTPMAVNTAPQSDESRGKADEPLGPDDVGIKPVSTSLALMWRRWWRHIIGDE